MGLAGGGKRGGVIGLRRGGIIEHKSNCYPAAAFAVIKGEMCNPGSDRLQQKWPKSDCHCAQWTSARGQQFGLVDYTQVSHKRPQKDDLDPQTGTQTGNSDLNPHKPESEVCNCIIWPFEA